MLEITHENLDTFFDSTEFAVYSVTIGNRQVMADPRDKGDPGDMVLVWPRKRAPMVTVVHGHEDPDDGCAETQEGQ